MKKFLSKMKDVKPSDLVGGLKFLIAIIPSLFYKLYLMLTHQSYWLICEEENEAQDNGWCFFQFMNERHKEKKTIYAIGKNSVMYDEVKNIGQVVNYGSILHWIYYLCAEVNISSQKGGKPNAAICYVLEVYGLLKNKRVFLQHGPTMNNCDYLHYENTKMWMFITVSEREANFVRDTFQYPAEYVQCSGFSRFDYLYNEEKEEEKYILLMPTWRYWLKLPSKVAETTSGEYDDFKSSEYFNSFQKLISDNKVLELLEEKNYKIIFYPHRNIQKHLECFDVVSDRIVLASAEQYSIQELLRKCSIMITDYSSVSFDFAYLGKPVFYFQFDLERFRKYQYPEGYFSYEKDGFGPVCYTYDNLVKQLKKTLNEGLEDKYRNRQEQFFKYHDKNNSERIYQAIRERCQRNEGNN